MLTNINFSTQIDVLLEEDTTQLDLPIANQVHSWYSNQGSCASMNSLRGDVASQIVLEMSCTSVELTKSKAVVLRLKNKSRI